MKQTRINTTGKPIPKKQYQKILGSCVSDYSFICAPLTGGYFVFNCSHKEISELIEYFGFEGFKAKMKDMFDAYFMQKRIVVLSDKKIYDYAKQAIDFNRNNGTSIAIIDNLLVPIDWRFPIKLQKTEA